MLDESLLDNPDALARSDTRGLLLGAAAAGARVRTAARYAAEAGVADLKPDGRPRSVIVAGPGLMAGGVAGLLGALPPRPLPAPPPSGPPPPAPAPPWAPPRWAGPLHLLVPATHDGPATQLTA